MKHFISIIFLFAMTPAMAFNPQVAVELDLKQDVGFVRFAAVDLPGGEIGFAVLFSRDADIDPWEDVFTFPKHTVKLALFNSSGEELWRRDLPNVISGTWFVPMFPFDMDGDGVDEIYIVNNTSDKPFKTSSYVLEAIDPASGKTIGQWPWTEPSREQSNSMKYRFFIFGGYVGGEPVLVTTQGTYGQMKLQGWSRGMEKRWSVIYPDDENGPRGSHSSHVFDFDNDGKDEFMWGERCISFDDGHELFVLGRNEWNNHSDVVLPYWNADKKLWYFLTCREKGRYNVASRSITYNQKEEKVWAIDELAGHFHHGWVADIGPGGERISLVGRYKIGTDKKGFDYWTYDSRTGEPVDNPVNVNGVILDFNGDGIHEIYTQGKLFNNRMEPIFSPGRGKVLSSKKILNMGGEQLVLCFPDGIIEIWSDKDAKDNPAQQKRYAAPHYKLNARQSAVGYNGRFPVLNY